MKQQTSENVQLYEDQNHIFGIAKAILFIAGAVLVLDYFSNKLIDAEANYFPNIIKLIGAGVMLILGASVNYLPKPVFLLAIISFFGFFGVWALSIYLVVEIIIKSNYNVASISILLILILKISLFVFCALKWKQGYNTINKLARLKKLID